MPSLNLSDSVYIGQRVALLTQHGKQEPLGKVLSEKLGCLLHHVGGFDTDRLGTFTRDIVRAGSQLEAARTKARIGMELSGLPIGLASEGAFGPDPIFFIMPHNLELLIWIDDRLGIEVVATASGRTNFSHITVKDWEEAKRFADSVGFPEHYLIVRPSDEHNPEYLKGLSDWASLRDAVNWAFSTSQARQAFIETDMRAFANPTRMLTIRNAAEVLVEKLRSLCPNCGTPGYAKSDIVRGLPCEDCGQPTEIAKADIYSCVRCEYQMLLAREPNFAAPRDCAYCNP